MSDTPILIFNPASAAGKTGRRKDEVLRQIADQLGAVDVVETTASGDAIRLARAATDSGRRRLLVGGGDGTLSEVANGVLEATKGGSGGPALGLLPLGSGFDFARSLSLPRDLGGALSVISDGHTLFVDTARVELTESHGSPRSVFVVNEAGAGLSAITIRIVGRFAKRVGARVGFAAGAVAAILSHRPTPMTIEVDGDIAFTGPVSLVVAANGRFFGAGMKIAPQATIDDGLLQVVIIRGMSLPQLLLNLPSLFAGTHGKHPRVSFYAARSMSISPVANDSAMPIELDLDGEAYGQAPIHVEVVPSALEIFAPVAPIAKEAPTMGDPS